MDDNLTLVGLESGIDLTAGEDVTAAGVDVDLQRLTIRFCNGIIHISRACAVHVKPVIHPLVIVGNDVTMNLNFHILTLSKSVQW